MTATIGNVPPGLNLFLKADPIVAGTKTTTLSIFGVTGGVDGVVSSAPLTIIGASLYATMNLFLLGGDSGATDAPMNLWIHGGFDPERKWTTLFIANSSVSAIESAELYIAGAGMWIDYRPASNDMNLYIEKGPQDGITLFICNNETPSTVELFISGSVPISTNEEYPYDTTSSRYGVSLFTTFRYSSHGILRDTGPSLFISGYGDVSNDDVDLFIQGVVPTEFNSQTTLVIPNVVGEPTEVCDLYINGFRY